MEVIIFIKERKTFLKIFLFSTICLFYYAGTLGFLGYLLEYFRQLDNPNKNDMISLYVGLALFIFDIIVLIILFKGLEKEKEMGAVFSVFFVLLAGFPFSAIFSGASYLIILAIIYIFSNPYVYYLINQGESLTYLIIVYIVCFYFIIALIAELFSCLFKKNSQKKRVDKRTA